MKKVVIIGGGVSGLAAGIYAMQSGFEAEIYEKHFVTGGVCTSWSRKGYTFEGSVHWLTDSRENRAFYRIWEEVGILGDGIKLHRNDPFSTLEYEGETISLYRNILSLKEELLRISPEDKAAIDELCADIKAMTKMGIPVSDIRGIRVKEKMKFGLSQILAMMPAIPKMGKLMEQTASEYLQKFKHEGIKTILADMLPDEFCAMALITTLATFCDNGYFPEGGALGIAERMTRKFESLGGKVMLSSAVEKVIVEDNRTAGIIVNRNRIDADAVIITRDVLASDCLFDAPPTDEWFKETQAHTKSEISTFAGIGVNADLSDLPCQFHYYLKTPFEFAGKLHDRIGFNNYASYNSYAPNGATALTAIFMENNYEWWAKAKEEGRYNEEKEKLAGYIGRALIEKFPQLRNKIDVIDIATPLTYERYTGSYHGAWMSIMQTHAKTKASPQTCKDIDCAYFAGFRMQMPGGLPVALASGRKAAQLLCKRFDAKFQGEI